MRTLLITCLLLTGCTGTPIMELGTGYNTSLFNEGRQWEDGGSMAFYGTIGQQWTLESGRTVKCQYMHISQIGAGPPFNDRVESSLDHFGCSFSVFKE